MINEELKLEDCHSINEFLYRKFLHPEASAEDYYKFVENFEKRLKRLEDLEKAFVALSKEDEKTKKLLSLEIEKNRVVDIIKAKLVDFNKLNRAEHNWKDDGCSSPVAYYNAGIVDYCQLTEEEYNFLVNMVGIRDYLIY